MCKTLWQRLQKAKRCLCHSPGSGQVLGRGHDDFEKTPEAIRSRLPVRGKKTALAHARLICLRSSEALTADEIARRILANGYSSRSKTFYGLRSSPVEEDRRFVANRTAFGRFA